MRARGADDATVSPAPIDWDALARYLAGESPDEEAVAVRRWLDAHPGDAALLRTLDEVLDRVAPVAAPTVDVDRALHDVMGRLDAPDVRPLRVPAPALRQPSRWRAPLLRAAAVLAVASTGALGWWAARRATPAAAPEQVYATAVGVRDSVRLPDGSRVVLGPGSRLVVGAGFGGGGASREVELTGEGWFEVVHDDARAFTVRAAGATIRDVGTAFTVRTGDGAARVRVAVQHGAVFLDATPDDAEGGVVLHQGDVGIVRADGRAEARPGAATDDDVAWTRGRLVFREASLDEVRAELRRWYGVELRVDDRTIAGRHVTASFEGERADRVLQVLALALGARVERRGDTAFVRPATR